MIALSLSHPYYENNLRIWDIRLSLFADVFDFGWGRFYVGGGLGAAFLESEVSVVGLDESANHREWMLSPSVQTGIIFKDVFKNVDIELAYRFCWFGDTESRTFSTGAKIEYADAHAHEVMLGMIVPFGT